MSLSLSRPLAARELSPPSSPHHTCGYDVLAKLVEVGEGKFLKDDVGDIMACVATDHKPLRKSVKVRPGLKALQMMCMNAIFEKAQGRLQKQAKKITVSQLFRDVKDLSEVVRAQAVSAVGTAFSLSAESSQEKMVESFLEILPPLPQSNEDEVLDVAWKDFSSKSTKSSQDQKATVLLRESMEKTAIRR